MKRLIVLTICVLAFGPAFAQKKEKVVMPNISALPQRNKDIKKSAIGGYFTDIRKRPIKGVQAFVYMPDSTIGASGYTDAEGYYETNSILPGRYNLKIVYPNNAAALTIMGVPVVASTITEVSFYRGVPPSADSSFPYEVIAPKPIEKPVKKK